MAESAWYRALGDAIRVRRTRAGLTQQELAERAGISKASVGHVETARRHASGATVRALADGLGVTVADLLADVPADIEEPEQLSTSRAPLAVEASTAHAAAVPGWIGDGRDDRWRAAEDVLRSPTATAALGARVREVLDGAAPEPLDEVRDVLELLAAMATDYARGVWRACPWEHAVLVVGALDYVAAPHDAVPDVVDGVGLVDDLGVVAFTARLVAPALQRYVRDVP